MRHAIYPVALYLALAMVAMTAAHAADRPSADATAKPQQTQDASLQDFIKANPDCLEFTDQCSHCAVADGVAECSTAEIACIKQQNQCTKRAGQQAKDVAAEGAGDRELGKEP